MHASGEETCRRREQREVRGSAQMHPMNGLKMQQPFSAPIFVTLSCSRIALVVPAHEYPKE